MTKPNQRRAIITSSFKTRFGELILGSIEDKLCLCDWRYRKNRNSIDTRLTRLLKAPYKEGKSEVLELAKVQINEYSEHKRQEFSVPLLTAGTDLQRAVWQQLQCIAFGNTKSYSDIALALNRSKAVRAIASANGANAISLFIPCHRVIGSNGDLVGYAGGLDAKRKLLELESDLFGSTN